MINKQGYNTIAVYGMGNIGKRLIKSLKNTEINIMYGIDNGSTNDELGVKVYSATQTLPHVDVVIVTVPFAYESVKDSLDSKVDCPIVSLEHILFEV